MTQPTMTPTDRKERHMGASRDFSSTAVLDREQRVRTVPPQTPLPKRRRQVPPPNRLGSRQVVSVRGRRISQVKRTTLLAKLVGMSIVLAIGGVAVAMWLSGVSTQQTFHLQTLQSQDRQLSNQLETLNRDLENVRSSAELARRAGELGMEVPNQPGILAVQENGDILETRPADPATRPIIDVNGAPVRPGQASSDPKAIDELGDSLEAIPQGERLRSPAEPGVAPYAPNVPTEDQ